MIQIATYTNIQIGLLNFVAYDGPRGVRITVVHKATPKQRKWFINVTEEEFLNPADRAVVRDAFNKAVTEFELKLSFLAPVNDGSASTLSHQMPGVKEKVTHPVSKNTQDVWSIIISLNDSHGWTREAIADWLETLDIDIRFEVPHGKTD